MKYIPILLTLSIMAGCASTTPKVQWVASSEFDRFTDETACSVSVGSLYTETSVYTYTNHYYPFIEVVNDELRVGLKSGGKYKIPVGDAQLRVDSNKAWDITMSETPVSVKPNAQMDIMTQYAKGLPKEQQQLVIDSYKAAMSSTGQMLSPFTVATGDKAKAILNEMLNGKVLIYRTLGFSQVSTVGGSTTGEYLLDDSLKAALNKCQIKV
jgi:hypothetical protein